MKIKAMALFCAVIMLAGILAGCGSEKETAAVQTQPPVILETPQPVVQTDSFTVHAHVPQSWYDIGIWAWSDSEGDVFDAWPGAAMVSEGNGWYSYVLPDWVNYIIINGYDGTVQTADISITANEVWIVVNEDGSCTMSYTEITDPDAAGGISISASNYDNSSYSAIFSSRNIEDSSDVSSSLSSISFAKPLDSTSGDIEKTEYGYEGDVVKEMAFVYYFDVKGWTEEDKIGLEDYNREFFAADEALDFVTVEHNRGEQFYQTKVVYRNVDDLGNMRALYEIGRVGGYEGYISVSECRESLLANGYFMKTSDSAGQESTDDTDSVYDEVFSRCGLMDTSLVSGSLKNYSYVMEIDNALMKLEFGCANGITQELAMVFYFETTGLSADEVAAMDQGMREMYGSVFERVSCATVTYRQLTNHYCMSAYFTDLDDAANVSQVIAVMEEVADMRMGVDGWIPEPTDAEYTSAGFIAK